MELRYATITGVARDDLEDGGAWLYAETVRAIHELNPDTGVENLIPDFNGKPDLLREVFESRPEVLAHNVETVPRIFKRIRPAFRYDRSLDVLTQARDFGLVTKSNLILGMGETREEVSQALRDLHDAGTELVTITQYLRPSVRHHPVERWVKPEEFVELAAEAEEIGFAGVLSGPLVRSSYRAGRLYRQAMDDTVYENVLGRSADSGGKNYWMRRLDAGSVSRGRLMIEFSESSENRTRRRIPTNVVLIYGLMHRIPSDDAVSEAVMALATQSVTHQGLIRGIRLSDAYGARFAVDHTPTISLRPIRAAARTKTARTQKARAPGTGPKRATARRWNPARAMNTPASSSASESQAWTVGDTTVSARQLPVPNRSQPRDSGSVTCRANTRRSFSSDPISCAVAYPAASAAPGAASRSPSAVGSPATTPATRATAIHTIAAVATSHARPSVLNAV